MGGCHWQLGIGDPSPASAAFSLEGSRSGDTGGQGVTDPKPPEASLLERGEKYLSRPVGSSAPNPTYMVTNWRELKRSNDRIVRFLAQMTVGGINRSRFDIFEDGETVEEALSIMGLELIPT